MIALYPVLVSNTISKNIIPGVCKSLENYIMIYGLNALLTRVRGSQGIKGDYVIRSNKVVHTENTNKSTADYLFEQIMNEASGAAQGQNPQSGIHNQTGPGNKTAGLYVDPEEFAKSYSKEKGKAAASPQDASVKLDTFNSQILSIEPTWMKIDQYDKLGRRSSGIIGVKVVPYAVKSDAELSQLLMYDNQVKGLQRLAILKGRMVTNFLYKVWANIWAKTPIIGGPPSDTVSGDPRQDIILKRNVLAGSAIQEVFVLANQSELSENFYSSAKAMKNLQKMGWGSMVIADDVNKRVAFCMKELQGMCSIVPYAMLYQSFSQARVYEDIEDAKRTSSSIFKLDKKAMTKVIGEGCVDNKLSKYNDFRTSSLNEDLSGLFSKLSKANISHVVTNISVGKVPDLPIYSPEKLTKFGENKLEPDFKKGVILATKVINNSIPNLNQTLVHYGAIAVCMRASLTKTDEFIESVKETLKFVIKLTRRLVGAPKDQGTPKSQMRDLSFGWIILALMFSSLLVLTPIVSGAASFIFQKLYQFGKFAFEKVDGIDTEKATIIVKEASKNFAEGTKEITGEAIEMASIGHIILAVLILATIWKMFFKKD